MDNINQQLSGLQEGILKELSNNCSDLKKNTYKFIARKKVPEKERKSPNYAKYKYIKVNMYFKEDEIIHYTGLEHLPRISDFLADKNNGSKIAIRKSLLLDKLKNGTFNESHLDNDEDIKMLNIPFSENEIPETKIRYNIKYRILTLVDLKEILSLSEAAKSIYIFQGWDKRKSKIPADYVVSIPSKNNKNEQIYLCGKIDKSKNNQDAVNIHIFSAFPDSRNITVGKPKPYKVVFEEIDLGKHKTQKIYIDPDYEKFLNENSEMYSSNIQKIQTNTPSATLVQTSNGAAVLKTPAIPIIRLPSFDDLSKVIKNIFTKLKNVADSFMKPSNDNRHNDKDNVEKRRQSAANKKGTSICSSSQKEKNSTVKTTSQSKEKPIEKQPDQPQKPRFSISQKETNKTPNLSAKRGKNKKKILLLPKSLKRILILNRIEADSISSEI